MLKSEIRAEHRPRSSFFNHLTRVMVVALIAAQVYFAWMVSANWRGEELVANPPVRVASHTPDNLDIPKSGERNEARETSDSLTDEPPDVPSPTAEKSSTAKDSENNGAVGDTPVSAPNPTRDAAGEPIPIRPADSALQAFELRQYIARPAGRRDRVGGH